MKFLTILLIEILIGIELDIFVPSFPDIQQFFELTPFLVELILSVNFCAYCISSIISGNLGDKYGAKPIMLFGFIIFTIGSIFCVLAKNYYLLIFGRLLQGIGIGPAVLAYVIISDLYPVDKQQKMMGFFNGIITIFMAIAPIIGSYINLFFGWRGNFIVLLIIGILCLIMTLMFIPYYKNEKEGKSINLLSYFELFKSPLAFQYILFMTFLTTPYWTFIGISPILYMEDLGVKLEEFGFYQGALAASFAILSLSSSTLLKKFGSEKCFYYSMITVVIGVIITFIFEIILDIANPKLITSLLIIWSFGVVFPINILWPMSLEAVPGAKGKMSAIMMSSRLLFTAICLEIAGYFYNGTFKNIAIIMCLNYIASFYSIYILTRKMHIFKTKTI